MRKGLVSRFSRAVVSATVCLMALATSGAGAAHAQMEVAPEITTIQLRAKDNSDGTVTFNVAVRVHDQAVPGGTVKVFDELTQSLVGTLDVSRPSITVPRLADGDHIIRAYYSGSDAFYPYVAGPSVSPPLQYAILVPDVDLSVSGDAGSGQLVTLRAIVTARAGKVSGLVMFKDSGKPVGVQVLDRRGQASFVTSAFDEGSHHIVAEYQGDATRARAVSTTRTLDVGAARFRNSVVFRKPRTMSGGVVRPLTPARRAASVQ